MNELREHLKANSRSMTKPDKCRYYDFWNGLSDLVNTEVHHS